MARSNLKVIIIGGGIGGLALANALQHTEIDFVVLEGRSRIDPQLGASIGILPNGARILDQIHCFDDLEKVTVSMEVSASRREDGSLIGDLSDTLKLVERRTGYPVFFLERRLLLKVLGEHIANQDRILLNKSVCSIEQLPDKAVVHCSDGTLIEGDIVVGADGVHSATRKEMWRHADLAGKGEMFHNDKQAMSAEYKCLFGISNHIDGMSPGQTDRTYAKGMSTLSYVGKGGIIFWFVFAKLDQVYYPPNIPRFTEEDTAELVQTIGSLPIRENQKVLVSDLYQNKISCNLVAIEEAAYEHWSFGRIVCLGDSIHKMTPNLGAGASSAIESAAILSNYIVRMASDSSHPPLASMTRAFRSYQKDRTERVKRTMQFSNNLTRVQALNSTKDFIYTHYIAPRTDDFAAEMFSSFVVGASLVDHLPVPTRSTQGTMPFNPQQGWGFEESKLARIKRALPLLALALFYLAAPTEDMFTSLTSDKRSQVEFVRAAYTDVLYCIWLLESTRLNNKGTFAQFPLLFGLALPWLGLDAVIPLYFFIFYVQSPIGNFRASDNRLTDTSYTCTAGILTMLLGWLPKYVIHHSALHQASAGWHWFVKLQPLLLSACQFLLAHSVVPSTIRHDRLWAVQRDMPWIRFNVGMLAVASSIFQSYRFLQSHSWLPALDLHGVSFTISTIMWLTLVFKDLRDAGMIKSRWITVFALGLTILVCAGPGGLLTVGWLLREEVLLSRRHKGAVRS